MTFRHQMNQTEQFRANSNTSQRGCECVTESLNFGKEIVRELGWKGYVCMLLIFMCNYLLHMQITNV